MRHEPPVLSQPAPDARPGAAGPAAMADDRSSSFGQDNAPGGGMSMILTKAIFITLGVATGAAGVVACFGSIEGLMIGVPLILLGFGCAFAFLFGRFRSVRDENHHESQLTNEWFEATGEIREHDQVTGGETRFATNV